MNNSGLNKTRSRDESFGQHGTSFIDRFGVYLSNRKIKKCIVNLSRPFSCLDIGCGYNARLLSELYDELSFGVGIDVKINKKVKDQKYLSFYEMNIEDALFEIQTKSFDLIVLISILEHLWNPEQILMECNRLLNPNGTLLINVPTWRGKYFLEMSAFKFGISPILEMNDHKMYYDKRDLWPLIVKSGFKPSWIRMGYHKFGLNLFATIKKPVEYDHPT